MKRLFFLLIFVLTASGVNAQVRWVEGSTDAVREQAIAQKKLVFIDLYADWCGPCRAMNEHVFTHKEVGEFFDRHFVAAKYNIERPTGRELMQRYGRGSIPLYLIFNTEGELLGSILGASPAEEFLMHLRRILAKQKEA